MQHWFDLATKAVAKPGVSRRDTVWRFAAAGLAGLFPQAAWAQVGDRSGRQARMGGVGGQAPGATAGALEFSVAVQHGDQTLQLDAFWRLPRSASSPAHLRARVTLGGVLVREIRFDSAPMVGSGGHGVGVGGRLEFVNGPSLSGPRHVVVQRLPGGFSAIGDGLPLSDEALRSPNAFRDARLEASSRRLIDAASTRASELRHSAIDAMSTTACDSCNNNCDERAIGCSIPAYALLEPWLLFGCAQDWYNCHQNCNRSGGPCCKTDCGNGTCCPDTQVCCGGVNGEPPTCCDARSVCVTGIADGIYPYAYCCPAGSSGCQDSQNGSVILYCRGPHETCCGWDNVCKGEEFCANSYWGICCAGGDTYCANAAICCDGNCITYNAGTSAQQEHCCHKPNVIWGHGGANTNPVCCPPAYCRTASNGEQVCCATPLCGDVCCTSPGVCRGGICEVGAPCGHTTCGLVNTCCGGRCCPENTKCINDQCCPTAQSCGSVCCAPGQFCSNGTCYSTCPDGADISTAPDGSQMCCQLYQCNNPSNDNICVAASCPGVCCAPNQVCCPTGTPGRYVCSYPPCGPVAQ